jgi:hypothetical protein
VGVRVRVWVGVAERVALGVPVGVEVRVWVEVPVRVGVGVQPFTVFVTTLEGKPPGFKRSDMRATFTMGEQVFPTTTRKERVPVPPAGTVPTFQTMLFPVTVVLGTRGELDMDPATSEVPVGTVSLMTTP